MIFNKYIVFSKFFIQSLELNILLIMNFVKENNLYVSFISLLFFWLKNIVLFS